MLNKIYKTLFLFTLLISPMLTFAAKIVPLQQTEGILDGILQIVTAILIPLAFTLALLLFFWGVVKYIWAEGQGKDEGKKIMVWGVIALFVMASVWGLVAFIADEFGIDDTVQMAVPKITPD